MSQLKAVQRTSEFLATHEENADDDGEQPDGTAEDENHENFHKEGWVLRVSESARTSHRSHAYASDKVSQAYGEPRREDGVSGNHVLGRVQPRRCVTVCRSHLKCEEYAYDNAVDGGRLSEDDAHEIFRRDAWRTHTPSKKRRACDEDSPRRTRDGEC
eukprot:CAMPEP_0206130364 /NCGR_PEP_ID=MMETSP1472-20131121/40515_1 /ASSEMBLY_ACC=CAM_ASM_001108 /TAXON_ID=41880 /ORGANISM="Pycnococcus provasolii, Strain RCC251" /LENGTH=157 /DNA_ID=CAMNT_0053521697 /DNA_START=39 /DNA_END=511 /DNA_ORIENTATION=+